MDAEAPSQGTSLSPQMAGLLGYFLERLHQIRWEGSCGILGCGQCDRLSNNHIRQLERLGYAFFTSNTPEDEGYHVAIVTEDGVPLLKDCELGLDFTFDEELCTEHGWPQNDVGTDEDPTYKWLKAEG